MLPDSSLIAWERGIRSNFLWRELDSIRRFPRRAIKREIGRSFKGEVIRRHVSASGTQASNSTVNELSLMLAGQRSLRRSTPVCSRNPRFPEGFAVERRERVSFLRVSLIFITRVLSAWMPGFNLSFDLSQWPTFPYIVETSKNFQTLSGELY